MLNFRKSFLFVLIILTVFVLSGCISFQGNQDNQPQSGPFGLHRSDDGGKTWVPKNQVLATGGAQVTLNNVAVVKIIQSPSFKDAIYLVTDLGLFYSYNKGESLMQDQLFKDKKINDVAISYHDKCRSYVAIGQSIWRSLDCMLTWEEVYFYKADPELEITELATDHYNKNIIYAGTNNGDILKSVDAGNTWKTIERLRNRIQQILVDRTDSRVIYFLTASQGIFKTTDGGENWSHYNKENDLNQDLNNFRESKVGFRLVQDPVEKNTLYYSSKFGLLKSKDGGMNWEKIELITAERADDIFSLAVDPGDNQKIFYGTANTLYKTFDGGETWSTQNSPSNARIHFLLFDSENSSIVYAGT